LEANLAFWQCSDSVFFVLVLERKLMNEPIFDHERLDVYHKAKTLGGMHQPACDQWLRPAQSIPLNIAEGAGKQSLKDKNRFIENARGWALECV
jgi:hypothetical protein